MIAGGDIVLSLGETGEAVRIGEGIDLCAADVDGNGLTIDGANARLGSLP